MFERELRDLAFVPRWVIARTIRGQSVAEHSFYVAVYADEIARIIGWPGSNQVGDCRLELMRAALWHDAEECCTGDIPGPAKRTICSQEQYAQAAYAYKTERFGWDHHVTGFGPNDIAIRAIIKVANLLEECLFLAEERQLGNKAVDQMFYGSRRRMDEAIRKLPGGDPVRLTRVRELAYAAINSAENGLSKSVSNDGDLK